MAQDFWAYSIQEGLRRHETGGPRSEVLAHWETAARLAPALGPQPRLQDYVETLRKQVADFARLAAIALENPETLPPDQRAEYYVQRFR